MQIIAAVETYILLYGTVEKVFGITEQAEEQCDLIVGPVFDKMHFSSDLTDDPMKLVLYQAKIGSVSDGIDKVVQILGCRSIAQGTKFALALGTRIGYDCRIKPYQSETYPPLAMI